ncbi:hypothetical protein AS593_06050 [Caulobacter vibrioides]|nr:hypothetical protein AS593_06050 [Caulobacter vibrioides]
MDSSIVTLCVGLATVLTSGVVSSVATYRLNRNKEQTFFMRQKAEALYLAADEFGRDVGAHVVTFFPVARGEIDYNQMLDLQIANPSKKAQGGLETMTMLVHIYFPEVQPHLGGLLASRDRWNELRAAHKAAYKAGEGVGLVWVAAFQSAGREIDLSVKDLQAAIVKSARHYAGASAVVKRAQRPADLRTKGRGKTT